VTSPPPRVKICGLTRNQDVACAVACGADMVGFIMVPWSPRAVTAGTVAMLRRGVPDGVDVVGVFADEDPDLIATLVERLALDYVQLHGAETVSVMERFGARSIKAYRLPTNQPIIGATVLLDRQFDADEPDAALEAHWVLARELAAHRRVLLAGALTSANVTRAVQTAAPWAVDSVRGTELRPGVKDRRLVEAFIRNAKGAL
jgi:phosphoribosylanthranilate isomerase